MNTIQPSHPKPPWTYALRHIQALLTWFTMLFSSFVVNDVLSLWMTLLVCVLAAVGFTVAVSTLTDRVEERSAAGEPPRRALLTPAGVALFGVMLLEALLLVAFVAAEFAPYSPLDLPRRALGYQGGLALERSTVGLSYSADGRWLLAAQYDGRLLLWQPSEPAEPRQTELGDVDPSLALFSPDGQVIALLPEDDTIQLRRTSDGALLRSIQQRNVGRMAFSPDSGLLATVGYEQPARVWRVADGQLLQTVEQPRGVNFVSFTPDNRLIARTVTTRDSDEHVEFAFSPDGRFVAIGIWDGRVEIVDAVSGQTLRTIDAHSEAIRKMAFSPDGTLLAFTGDRGERSVRVWRVADGKPVALYFPKSSGSALAFSPDNRTLAVDEYERISLWRVPEQR